jgi:hypothetical protein
VLAAVIHTAVVAVWVNCRPVLEAVVVILHINYLFGCSDYSCRIYVLAAVIHTAVVAV